MNTSDRECAADRNTIRYEAATDLQRSFVVRAPAGSGKTELLIQRYFQSLLKRNDPTHAIALTFTQKSALELRERVCGLLNGSLKSTHPLTQQLAQRVQEKMTQCQWDLTHYPEKCMICTLDAYFLKLYQRFCENRAQGHSQLILDPMHFYQKSAQQFLLYFTQQSPNAIVLAFIQYGHQRFYAIQDRIAELFALRDRWMLTQSCRSDVAWDSFFQEELHMLQVAIGDLHIVQRVLDFTLSYRSHQSLDNNDTQTWALIAQAILTERGQWRKSWRSDQGIPLESHLLPWHTSADRKAVILDLQTIQERVQTQPILKTFLSLLRPFSWSQDEPGPSQDSVFHQLMRLIAAWSDVAKKEEGLVDFIDITKNVSDLFDQEAYQGAIEAFCEQNIHDLFLDEAQDLSWSQAKIIHNIVHTLADSDKSFFIVGDPQQAIYYFRGSDLSVFQSFESLNVSGLDIQSLALTENFRSTPELVHFVNRWSAQTFGPLSSAIFGIDRSITSIARSVQHEGSLENHHFESMEQEAYGLARMIVQRHKEYPSEKIAILARDRRTLRPIAAWLRSFNIAPDCAELENLHDQEIYHDCMAFFKMIFEPCVRSHWLVFLNSRWLRATYQDIEAYYAQESPDFWDCPTDELSPVLQQDLRPFLQVYREFILYKDRCDTAHWLSKLCHALHWEDALASFEKPLYWDLLKKMQSCEFSQPIDWDALASWAKTYHLHSVYHQSHNRISLLTIHKAKGLEFDTVFLPNLGARLPVRTKPLWIFARHRHGAVQGSALDPQGTVFDKLWMLDKYHHDYEAQRLLYVALTRAKMHLILSCNHDQSDARSFYHSLESAYVPQAQTHHVMVPCPMRRLSLKTPLPAVSPWDWSKMAFNDTPLIWKAASEYDLQFTVLGKVFHEFLRSQTSWPWKIDFMTRDLWVQWWCSQGGGAEDYEVPFRNFGKWLVRLQNCPMMAKIFDPKNVIVHTEQEFCLWREDLKKVETIRVDRLVKTPQGQWWLIDWKTTSQSIKRREILRAQLESYQRILQIVLKESVEVGVYVLSEQAYYSDFL